MTGVPVLQVVTSTDRRGAETFAVELAPRLVDRGFAVETVALRPGHGAGLDLPVLGRSALAPSTLGQLRDKARAAAVVVAHGSTTLPACAIALVASRTPFVYRNIGDPTHWSKDPIRRWRTAAFLARARRVVALSDAAARTLSEQHHVRAHRLDVIPTGVSAARFPEITTSERAAARAALELPDNAVVALAIGALSPEKQVDLAIAAVAESAEIDVLVVVGDGPERVRLEELARRVAPDRIRFLGALGDPRTAYAAGDLVVLTSRTEGLPAVLIEAGLAGLPVVATDVGYVRDIVLDGQTGMLTPPSDLNALRVALDSAGALTTTARDLAPTHCRNRFDLDTVVADRWAAVLERVSA